MALSYKFLGVAGCLPKPSPDQSTKRVSCSTHLGQHGSSRLFEKRRIPIHFSQQVNETNHQPQDPEELVPVSEPLIRHQERGSRLLIQEGPSVNRMDARQDVLPVHQLPSTSSGGRSVCHKTESSTTSMCPHLRIQKQ